MDLALPKCILEQNFQLLTHPPTLDLRFYKCRGMQKVCVGHYEKMCAIAKLPLPPPLPPNFGSLVFRVLTELENLHWPL